METINQLKNTKMKVEFKEQSFPVARLWLAAEHSVVEYRIDGGKLFVKQTVNGNPIWKPEWVDLGDHWTYERAAEAANKHFEQYYKDCLIFDEKKPLPEQYKIFTEVLEAEAVNFGVKFVKKVSFDFDGVLTRPSALDYAKELVSRGVDVYITTSRLCYSDDMFHFLMFTKIQKHKVRFVGDAPKWKYLEGFLWHLDDDFFVVKEIDHNSSCIAVNVLKPNWKEKCENMLKR